MIETDRCRTPGPTKGVDLSCGRLVADPEWEAHRWSEIDALLARADELAAGILGVSTSPAAASILCSVSV
jgi:hypothetical protein